MKIAVITGSRNYTDAATLRGMLDAYAPGLLLHGDCATGADRLAAAWARDRCSVPVLAMPAAWSRLDKAAGPARNAAMVKVAALLAEHGHEVCVFGFPLPGSRGTRDCLTRARNAGLTVCEVRPGTCARARWSSG